EPRSTEVMPAPRGREPLLPDTFASASAIDFGRPCVTTRTRHAILVFGRRAILRRERFLAAVAHRRVTGATVVRDRDAFVEHEAFPAPARALGRDALQIMQDTPLELVDLPEPA